MVKQEEIMPENQDKKKQFQYLNVLNVLACFFVLWDHVNGAFFSFEASRTWMASVAIHLLTNPGVPLFAMISGATLLGYREKYSTKIFARKRLSRAVLPFLIWSVLYMLLRIYTGEFTFSISGAITGIFTARFNSIFWFFPPLFGTYLAMPIFSAVSRELRQRVYGYCIIAYFVLAQMIPFLCGKCGIQYDVSLQFQVVSGFMFYVITGYYIHQYGLGKRLRLILYGVGMACFIYNVLDCILLSMAHGEVTRTFTGCFAMAYMPMGIALFTLFRYGKPAIIGWLDRVTAPFRELTFGIYLVQVFVLAIVGQLPFIDVSSKYYIVFGIIPIFLICAGVSFVIKRIPGLRRII